MQIAQSKTRSEFPLSRKKIAKKTLAASLVWLILLAIYVVVSVLLAVSDTKTEGKFWILGTLGAAVFGIIFLIILLTYLYQRWYYAVYFYDLSPDYIIIKKGPITPHEITIPYERIQDVYVDQDLLDRMFGLYDVHLSSATISSGMAAHIDGVEKAAADGLRASLLKTVSERISKNRSSTPAQS